MSQQLPYAAVMISNTSDSTLLRRLVARLYDKAFIRNVLRGELVEQMVLDALGAGWVDAADYESWDIRHVSSGVRIQVKQSAARQSWAQEGDRPSKGIFSIALRNGYSSESARWDKPPARRCDLYIFAWHPRGDAMADQRDPARWQFFIVPTSELPNGSSITLNGVRMIAAETAYSQLASAVEKLLL